MFIEVQPDVFAKAEDPGIAQAYFIRDLILLQPGISWFDAQIQLCEKSAIGAPATRFSRDRCGRAGG